MKIIKKLFGGRGTDQRKKGDSCMPEYNVTDTPMLPIEFSPDSFATKIIVAGDLNQSKKVADSVMEVQKSLSNQVQSDFPDTKLLMSVETFLDNCRHSTDWSSNPSDINSKSTKWHCYQTETKFDEAIKAMINDKQNPDIVIIIGDSFDNELDKIVNAVEDMHKTVGTKFFALPTTSEETVKNSYEAITKASNGLCLPLLNDNDYDLFVKEIVQATLFKKAGKSLDNLPALENDKAKNLRLTLQNS